MRKSSITKIVFCIISCCLVTQSVLSEDTGKQAIPGITINAKEKKAELGPYLYGLFFEDINWAADGGLYAELVQNRSFEYYSIRTTGTGSEFPVNGKFDAMTAWEVIYRDNGKGFVDATQMWPMNEDNRHSLYINVNSRIGWIGARNSGYDGIPVKAGDKYSFSLFARHDMIGRVKAPTKGLRIALERADGTIIASKEIPEVDGSWTKYEGEFVASATDAHAYLSVTADGFKHGYQVDMVSLFPQKTFKNRKNGMRLDLATALKDLKPSFMRFPGGCLVHGFNLENTYNWKDTVGEIEDRKPNWNRWGYHQTYGLGYFEYFQLSEDLDSIPLPVIPIGVSCSFQHFESVPMEQLHETIQDALDLVEFANGDINSQWGKVRAEMGHPEPFGLEYICLGNEEGNKPEVLERIPKFVEAFRSKYPEIKLIGTSGLGDAIPLYEAMAELNVWSSDEHYYRDPEWYIENQNRFDEMDRSKPKIFVGEYASRGNTMYNAVAEAVYLTGVERNADHVEMTCYAPLFAHYDHSQWQRADLIWFDNHKLVKTPNYYVQQMFAQNKGDYYLENEQRNWPGNELATAVTLDESNGELIIKIANASETGTRMEIDLEGVGNVSKKGTAILLCGSKDAINSRDNSDNVHPVEIDVKTGKSFFVEVPAISVQFIRVPIL